MAPFESSLTTAPPDAEPSGPQQIRLPPRPATVLDCMLMPPVPALNVTLPIPDVAVSPWPPVAVNELFAAVMPPPASTLMLAEPAPPEWLPPSAMNVALVALIL